MPTPISTIETPPSIEDDRWRNRVNNDVTQGNSWGRGALERQSWYIRERENYKGYGHIIIPTPDMRLHSNRHLTGLNRDWTKAKSHHDLQVWHTQQREILDDTNGNLGQGNLMIDWSYHSVGIRGFHRWTDSERWF